MVLFTVELKELTGSHDPFADDVSSAHHHRHVPGCRPGHLAALGNQAWTRPPYFRCDAAHRRPNNPAPPNLVVWRTYFFPNFSLNVSNLAWVEAVDVLNKPQIVFNASHLIIKLSYLALYLSLVPNRRSRIVVYGAVAFVIIVGATFICLSIFLCTPISRGWDKSVPGTCINDEAFLLNNAVFNMVADAIVFAVPLPMLWSLQRMDDPTDLTGWNLVSWKLMSFWSSSSCAALDPGWHIFVRCCVSNLTTNSQKDRQTAGRVII